MIIKSHVRGGYRAAANYLKQQGANEVVRLVEISDTSAKDLDGAFRNMWLVGRTTRASKPLHHVSINPYRDERLTDAQVRLICARLEQKFGYKPSDHQRVIVEHIKDGRQHFHVMWNRVSLRTGRPVWPGHHWKKSKQAAREMETELDLKRPMPRRARKCRASPRQSFGRSLRAPRPRVMRIEQCANRQGGRPLAVLPLVRVPRVILRKPSPSRVVLPHAPAPAGLSMSDLIRQLRSLRAERTEARNGDPNSPMPVRPQSSSVDEIIAWAWEHRRADVLAMFGIYVSFNL